MYICGMTHHEPFAFLNDFFDKIFVVSLRRATDRQADIQKELHGLNYEFWWAVDKRDFEIETLIQNGTYDEDKALKVNRHGIKKMLAGEVACAWSHRDIYQATIDNNYERVLIFEDDVVVRNNTISLLPHTLKQLPQHWEFCYLGYLQNETFSRTQWFKKQFYKLLSSLGAYQWLKPSHVERLFSRPYSENLRLAGLHDCTHAYGLTRSAAQTLLTAQTPIYSSADELLAHQIIKGNMQAFISTPPFFDQQDFINGHQNSTSYIWS
jgi:glycosyl transferase, family 25